MATRKPLVLVSGGTSELPPGDSVEGVILTTTLTAGSGLLGGGLLATNQRIDVGIASNPSGLILVGNQLGLDGVAQRTADAAQASGNAALTTRLPLTGGTLTGPLNVSGTIVASGVIIDTFGNVRTVPQTAVGTSTYTLASGDVGKHIAVGSGVITVPSGVFLAGDAISIFNTSSGVQTISGQAGIVLRQAGTTNTGQRSVSAYGLTTVLCVNNTQIFVITGAGLLP